MLKDKGNALTIAAMASEIKRRKCIADYHAMLERIDLRQFAESLQAELRERKVMYGQRPVCPFLRPNFITAEQMAVLRQRIQGVAAAMQILVEHVLHDESLQNFLGLTAQERELLALEPGYSSISTTARFDTFLNGGSCSIVEYNAESPAGLGYTDTMSQAFMHRPEFQEFAAKHRLQAFTISQDLLQTLLKCWQEWSRGASTKPTIAIVDFAEVPTHHEFRLLADYFQSQGYRAIIADPRHLEYDGSHLSAGGVKIDVLYRRVLANEFLEKIDQEQAMYKALKDRKVCMVNSVRSKILHKKDIFALLTDENYWELFTVEQIKAIRACIPWTRRLQAMDTSDPQGQPVALLDYVMRQRRNLVLKPNDSYGGRGIYFGWEENEEEWAESVREALQHDYLVQTRIPVTRELFPYWNSESGLEWGEYLVDLDPYVFDFKLSGVTTRLSSTSLCNVTSGGGSAPCLVLN